MPFTKIMPAEMGRRVRKSIKIGGSNKEVGVLQGRDGEEIVVQATIRRFKMAYL